jgi:hypothetical protein
MAGGYQIYVPLCKGETVARVLIEGNGHAPPRVIWDVSQPHDASQQRIDVGDSSAFASVDGQFQPPLPDLINVTVYTSQDRAGAPRFTNLFVLNAAKSLNGGHNLNYQDTTENDLKGLACGDT